ncbi:hypothetical protein [Clostridium thermobutyricum]|uniref:Type VI secretion system spike protein VgrG3-like C-terminal domain-containing protein n=1 Tax=Clostridium thermobutyricum DSM 4928 TaxID=1121339 RepID=A0A1V4SYS6_9CLOT|nr:hypothetical protein [Clostridium thermobutyricum]OPX50399.1 hypothetical protein CLTHE_02560 [Clostridium thermobutyricum DSM 4928]
MKRIFIAAAVTAAITGATGTITAHADTINHSVRANYISKKNNVRNKVNNQNANNYYTTRQITQLSAIFESNNNPGSISTGKGDFGGKSYGAWQFSSNTGTLAEFINFLKRENYSFYFALVRAEYKQKGIQYGNEFDNVWKSIANKYPNTFYNLQMEFIRENYYDKLVRMLRRDGGFSKMLSNLAVQNVLVSTAVQNGVMGAYKIISPLKYRDNPRDFIKDIYNRRALVNEKGVLVNFYSSSNSVQQAIKWRLVREEDTALSMC